jgi:hypothetical protein
LIKPSANSIEQGKPQLDLARRVLSDTDKLRKRTLHIAPALKFMTDYLIGYIHLKLFYEKV